MLIETFVPKSPIERLDECVLCGLARFDEVQIYFSVAGPNDHRFRGELGTVIDHDFFWQSADVFKPFHLDNSY